MIELLIKPAGNRWWWGVLVDGNAKLQGYEKSQSAAQRRLDEASRLFSKKGNRS